MSDSIVFDRAASFYDQTRGFAPGEEQHAAALMAQAGSLTPTMQVLEVGVGTGRIALPLSTHVGTIYGIDLARAMMARLREKQRGERIFVAEADALRLPFSEGTFDAAVIVHVLHLIPAWQSVVREIERVLKPGAPLLHADSGSSNTVRAFSELWDAWETVVHDPDNAWRSERYDRFHNFFIEDGWQPRGERLERRGTAQGTPAKFIERLEKRIWSSLWRLSDAELEAGVAAVREKARAVYDDLDQPVDLPTVFGVQAYTRPAR